MIEQSKQFNIKDAVVTTKNAETGLPFFDPRTSLLPSEWGRIVQKIENTQQEILENSSVVGINFLWNVAICAPEKLRGRLDENMWFIESRKIKNIPFKAQVGTVLQLLFPDKAKQEGIMQSEDWAALKDSFIRQPDPIGKMHVAALVKILNENRKDEFTFTDQDFAKFKAATNNYVKPIDYKPLGIVLGNLKIAFSHKYKDLNFSNERYREGYAILLGELDEVRKNQEDVETLMRLVASIALFTVPEVRIDEAGASLLFPQTSKYPQPIIEMPNVRKF
jgi:hypothetical protein